MDQIDRHTRQSGRRGGGGGSNGALTTLAKESFDILTLLPTYIESTKTAVSELKQDTQVRKFDCLGGRPPNCTIKKSELGRFI